MFTCIKVLRPPAVKGGLCVWNMNHRGKQHVAGWARTNIIEWEPLQAWKELSLNRGQGQDGRIREVLQRIAAQVCMNVYNKPVMFLSSLQIEECNVQGARLICLFLCRLKINHDTHEFILEYSTVTNNYYIA